MRILLDECVPWPMHHILANHQCTLELSTNDLRTIQAEAEALLNAVVSIAPGEFRQFILSVP